MNEITWTNDDVKLVEKFIEIKNKGFYVSGEELTNAYNRILHKHVNVTQCGSCLRQRVSELEGALNHFKAKMAQESVSEVKVDNTPQDENKAVVEAGNDEIKARMTKVRAAKKAKKEE